MFPGRYFAICDLPMIVYAPRNELSTFPPLSNIFQPYASKTTPDNEITTAAIRTRHASIFHCKDEMILILRIRVRTRKTTDRIARRLPTVVRIFFTFDGTVER